MKKLNSFISWLYIMGTIVVGVFLMLAVSGWSSMRERIELSLSSLLAGATGLWAGLSLIALGLIFLAIRAKANKTTRNISFDNPEGEVTISIKAVEDFVKKVGIEFAEVLDMSPKIKPAKDGIKVTAKTTMVAGVNVPKLAESIQRDIKSRLQNIMGIENISGVTVHVSKLVTREKTIEKSGVDKFSILSTDTKADESILKAV